MLFVFRSLLTLFLVCLSIEKLHAELPTDSAEHILFISNDVPDGLFSSGVLNQNRAEPIWDLQQKQLPSDQQWLFFGLFSVVLLWSSIRYFYPKSLEDLKNSLLSINLSKQIYYGHGNINLFSNLLMKLTFFLTLSAWIHLIAFKQMIGIQSVGFIQWILLAAILFLLFSFKHLAITLVAFLFPQNNEVKLYRYNCWQLHYLSGMILLPLCFLIAFASCVMSALALILSGALLCIILIVRVFKGISLSGKYILHKKFLFILYVCTLEIAPVLIFLRLMYNWQVF